MNYKNILYASVAVMASVLLPSCGNGTEDLAPGQPPVNFFEVDPDDKSEEGNLRRDFYNDNGVYLLFTDLLASYIDENGIAQEERVDLNWSSITDNTSYTIKFDLLQDHEKKDVADLISKYFLPYINIDGGVLKPYSLLLVKNLAADIVYSGEVDPTPFISCWRCMAIDVSDWIGVDEDEALSLGKNLIKSVIDRNLDSSSSELVPFFEIGEECYDAYYISDIIPDWVYEQNMEWLYDLGFMYYIPDTWDDDRYYDAFPSKKNDLKNYMNSLFSMSEEEFMEAWQDYPAVMLKYNLLKECIINAGIDLNAVK